MGLSALGVSNTALEEAVAPHGHEASFQEAHIFRHAQLRPASGHFGAASSKIARTILLADIDCQ